MSVTFAEIGVPADLAASLARRDITEPFAIQAATIPDALAGRDVSGKAPTGSGKTLAFGLPLVARVGKARARKPRALVLVPTRELAAQVATELKPLAGARGRSVAAFYGGTGYGPQRKALGSGCEIVVACPGRLEDLIRNGDISLAEVDIVVVDEADRMADMGFLPVVRRLLDQVQPDRQTLLFSATLDGDIDDLVRRYQRDPVRHELEDSAERTGDVDHRFWRVPRAQRVEVTAKLVQRSSPAVVFCRTKHGADRVARQLTSAGVTAVAIHGDRSQAQRDRALASFRAGGVQALVATDVAARGIHVDDVACVVHFDPPADDKDYVHRSGRTGRAGADGLVVSLVHEDVVTAVRALQRALGRPTETTPPDVAEGPVPARAPGAAAPTRPSRTDAVDRPRRPPASAPDASRRKGPRPFSGDTTAGKRRRPSPADTNRGRNGARSFGADATARPKRPSATDAPAQARRPRPAERSAQRDARPPRANAAAPRAARRRGPR